MRLADDVRRWCTDGALASSRMKSMEGSLEVDARYLGSSGACSWLLDPVGYGLHCGWRLLFATSDGRHYVHLSFLYITITRYP